MFICTYSMTTCYFHYKKSESANMFCDLRIINPTGTSLITISYILFSFISAVFYHPFNLITFFPSAISFLFFTVCCFQRGKIHGNRPLSCVRPACRELSCQASLPPEEPVPAAHDTQSPAATDWHTVRDWNSGREYLCCTLSHRKVEKRCRRYTHLCFPPPLRSDKLRWISALSRPHPEIDFSAAQGEVCCLVWTLQCAKLLVISRVWNPLKQ